MEDKRKEEEAKFVVYKSYPQNRFVSKSHYAADERIVQFKIETINPLPPSFDRELETLIAKYCNEK